MAQYKTVTTVDEDGVSWDMLEVQYPDKVGPITFERSYECVICGFTYPKSQVSLKGGAAFCHPSGCYLEMNSVRTGGKV